VQIEEDINWPEMLRDIEHWVDGFLTGAAAVSLIAIAGLLSFWSLVLFEARCRAT
jgi:hypothetical protein